VPPAECRTPGRFGRDLGAGAAQVFGTLTRIDGAVHLVTYLPGIKASQARLGARANTCSQAARARALRFKITPYGQSARWRAIREGVRAHRRAHARADSARVPACPPSFAETRAQALNCRNCMEPNKDEPFLEQVSHRKWRNVVRGEREGTAAL
jgi:hypothetical protein